jgi:hypothetical protein
MRIPRSRMLAVAFLLGLHLLMLAGLGATHGHAGEPCLSERQPAPAVAETTGVTEAATRAGPVLKSQCAHHAAHDMAITCLAILIGVLLVRVTALLAHGQPAPVVRRLCRWAAPVLRPPTPPPIAFGVQRK